MDIDCKLGPDPFITSLPACAIQEDIIPVLSHVPHQVICEPQVCSGWVKQLPKFWIVDLDQCFFYLEGYPGTSQSWDIHTSFKMLHLKKKTMGNWSWKYKKNVTVFSKISLRKSQVFTLKFLYTFSIFIKNAFLFLENMDSGR